MNNEKVKIMTIKPCYAMSKNDEQATSVKSVFDTKSEKHRLISAKDERPTELLAFKLGLSMNDVRKNIKDDFIKELNSIIDEYNTLNDKLQSFVASSDKKQLAKKTIAAISSFTQRIENFSLEEMLENSRKSIKRENLDLHAVALAVALSCLDADSDLARVFKLAETLANENKSNSISDARKPLPITAYDFVSDIGLFNLYDLIADQLLGNSKLNYAQLGTENTCFEQLHLAENCVNDFMRDAKADKVNRGAIQGFLELLKLDVPLGFSINYIPQSEEFAAVLDCVDAIHFDKSLTDMIMADCKNTHSPINAIRGLLLQAAGYDFSSQMEATIARLYSPKDREALKVTNKGNFEQLFKPITTTTHEPTAEIVEPSKPSKPSEPSPDVPPVVEIPNNAVETITTKEKPTVPSADIAPELKEVKEKPDTSLLKKAEIETFSDDKPMTSDFETPKDHNKKFRHRGVTIGDLIPEDVSDQITDIISPTSETNLSSTSPADDLDAIFKRQEEDRKAKEDWAKQNAKLDTSVKNEILPERREPPRPRSKWKQKEYDQSAEETKRKKQAQIAEDKRSLERNIGMYLAFNLPGFAKGFADKYPDVAVDFALKEATRYEGETKQKALKLVANYCIPAIENCIKENDLDKAETYYNHALANLELFTNDNEKLIQLNEIALKLGKEPQIEISEPAIEEQIEPVTAKIEDVAATDTKEGENVAETETDTLQNEEAIVEEKLPVIEDVVTEEQPSIDQNNQSEQTCYLNIKAIFDYRLNFKKMYPQMIETPFDRVGISLIHQIECKLFSTVLDIYEAHNEQSSEHEIYRYVLDIAYNGKVTKRDELAIGYEYMQDALDNYLVKYQDPQSELTPEFMELYGYCCQYFDERISQTELVIQEQERQGSELLDDEKYFSYIFKQIDEQNLGGKLPKHTSSAVKWGNEVYCYHKIKSALNRRIGFERFRDPNYHTKQSNPLYRYGIFDITQIECKTFSAILDIIEAHDKNASHTVYRNLIDSIYHGEVDSHGKKAIGYSAMEDALENYITKYQAPGSKLSDDFVKLYEHFCTYFDKRIQQTKLKALESERDGIAIPETHQKILDKLAEIDENAMLNAEQSTPVTKQNESEDDLNIETNEPVSPIAETKDDSEKRALFSYVTKTFMRKYSSAPELLIGDCIFMKKVLELSEKRKDISLKNVDIYKLIIKKNLIDNDYQPVNYHQDALLDATKALDEFKEPSIDLPNYVIDSIDKCCKYFERYYSVAVEQGLIKADQENTVEEVDKMQNESQEKQVEESQEQYKETVDNTSTTQTEDEVCQAVIDDVAKRIKKGCEARLSNQQYVLLKKIIDLKTKRSIPVEHKELFLDVIKEKYNSGYRARNKAIDNAINYLKQYQDSDSELSQSLLNMCEVLENYMYKCLKHRERDMETIETSAQQTPDTSNREEPIVKEPITTQTSDASIKEPITPSVSDASIVEDAITPAEVEVADEEETSQTSIESPIVETAAENENDSTPTEEKAFNIKDALKGSVGYLLEDFNLDKLESALVGGFAISLVEGVVINSSEIKLGKRTISRTQPLKVSIDELKAYNSEIDDSSDFVKSILANLEDVSELVNIDNISSLAADAITYKDKKLDCENLRVTNKKGIERTISN